MADRSQGKKFQPLKNPILQMEPWFDNAEANAVYEYMNSGGWLMEFTKTRELEKLISNYTGAKYCTMTVNGTISLMLALLALGLKPDEQVLVPNLTMIATPNAAVFLGIKPVFVDVEADTLCLDLDMAERKLTKKTKAVIYVAMNGRSGDMDKVVGFCKKNNLYLIEDAAQALGSYYKGKHLGTFGDIGSFSLSVPKVITTGQGGALITNKAGYIEKIRKMKDFGRISGGLDIHNEWGWNFKYTDLQAVIGIEQMRKLSWRLKRKKKIYVRYMEGLGKVPKVEFLKTNLTDTSPWFVDIYTQDPESLSKYLKTKGIGTRRIYPPISSQKIYKHAAGSTKFPISNKFASRGLWLPSSSKLSDEEIDTVVWHIKNYFELSKLK